MDSMTSISATAAARREAARHSNGEFGEHAHSAPELNLEHGAWPQDLGKTHYAGQWGEISVAYGARTPWGPAQHEEQVAEGIVFVPTEGHGGYKLSRERNAIIPPAFRSSSGWYEEDTERRIVELYHFDAVRPGAEDRSARLEELDQGLRDWFPAQWENANGRDLEPGESHVKDEQTWAQDNADFYVTTAQQTIEDGLLLVTARRASTGDVDQFILSRTARDAAQDAALDEPGARGRFRIPEGVKPQKRPEPAPAKPAFTAVPSLDGLTAAAAKKVQTDLDQPWRLRATGEALTLRQQIEQGHITQKCVVVSEGGTRQFYLENGNTGSVIKVSKATFDAFEAPDTRTAKDRAREEWQIAQAKQDKAQRAVDGAWRPTPAQHQALREARAAVNAAYAVYQEAAD